MSSNAIMGLFEYQDDFLQAAGKLKEAGYQDLTLMSPIPIHGIEEVMGKRKNNVRYFSLAGAIIGAICGFGMTVATALAFILPTGGRPIIPIPPYLVITYEMTILFGVLFTLLGFHFVSGLPAWRDKPYVTEINEDRFVVLVPSRDGHDLKTAEGICRDHGALEVREVEE